MGTGSSKARRWSPAARWKASSEQQGSGGGGGGGSNSAPARLGREEEEERLAPWAAAAAAEPACRGDQPSSSSPPRATPPPPPPPAAPDSDLELLDQVLAECSSCYDDVDKKLGRLLRRQRLPPPRLDAGDSCLPPVGGDGGEGEGGIPLDPQVVLSGSTPESSNFANKHPLTKPERPAKISYDYSEEELMANIEQEYGR